MEEMDRGKWLIRMDFGLLSGRWEQAPFGYSGGKPPHSKFAWSV
jgi:hypothetical protein